MDKELNLIIKLANDPSNATEAGKLTAAFEKAKAAIKENLDATLDAEKQKRTALAQEEALQKNLVQAVKQRTEAEKRLSEAIKGGDGRQIRNAAERLGEAEESVRAVKTALEGAVAETDKWIDVTSKLKGGFDNLASKGVRAFENIQKELHKSEREVERLTQSKSKAYEKLFKGITGGFQATISLARSAALAYASVMKTDDKTVQQWLQWFAAIESVSQAISGVYGLYKNIKTVQESLNKLRVIDIGLATAQARAEAAVCAAKACGVPLPGKGGGGGGGGGFLSSAGRFAMRAAGAALPIASGIAGAGGLIAGGSLLLQGGDTGDGGAASTIAGGLESFAGMIGTEGAGDLFQPYARAAYNRQRADEMAKRLPLERAYVQAVVNARTTRSAEYQADVARGEAGVMTSTAGAVAGMGWRSNRERMRVMEGQIEASENAQRYLRDRAGSIRTMEGGREQMYRLQEEALREEQENIKRIIDLKKEEQRIALQSAQTQKRALESAQSIAKQTQEFYKAIAEDAKRERESVAKGLLGVSRGAGRRALDARAKAEAGEALSYREAMAIEQAGLATNDNIRNAVAQAQEQETVRRYGQQAADLMRGITRDEEEARDLAAVAGAEADLLKADVKVATEIIIKLEKDQEKELENLMGDLEPRLREILTERNDLLLKALQEKIETEARRAARSIETGSLEEATQNALNI